MKQFVESLKRLYREKQITDAHVVSLQDKGKITQVEAEYILNAPINQSIKKDCRKEQISRYD